MDGGAGREALAYPRTALSAGAHRFGKLVPGRNSTLLLKETDEELKLCRTMKQTSIGGK